VAYLAATERTLQRGPHSAYYVVEADLNELRGRIDANRQRLRYGLPLPVAVTYDDFGVDTDENRLLAGAAVQLQRLPGLPGSIRRRLRRVLAALDGVEPARRDSARATHLTRLNEHYRPALAVARAVLAGVSFETRAGPRSVTGLIVDMNQLFEKFLEVALQEALAGVPGGQLSPQCSDYLDDDKRAQIKPDLTWVVNGAPRAVIDAKYKSIEDGRPAEADIYQVVSYAIALSLDRAFLVYATPATWKPSLAIRSSKIRVTVTGVDLALPLADLRAAIATLAMNIATNPHLQAGVHTDP
jgi:5-methylcytosine-specific restriction enzyme subunit McrC